MAATAEDGAQPLAEHDGAVKEEAPDALGSKVGAGMCWVSWRLVLGACVWASVRLVRVRVRVCVHAMDGCTKFREACQQHTCIHACAHAYMHAHMQRPVLARKLACKIVSL